MFASIEVRPTEPVPISAAILAVPGLRVRKRFEVTAEELRAKNADAPSADFERAVRALLTVNFDVLATADFLRVGLEIQEKFSKASSAMLTLASSSKLDEVTSGLREMGLLLSSTNLEQAFNPSSWKKLFGAPSIDECMTGVKEKLAEISERTKKLMDEMPQVSDLAKQAEVLGRELDQILSELESEIVVARYMTDHLTQEKELYSEWADLLKRRVDSLLVSRITLRQATTQLKMIREELRHLTETVQTALMNMVPAWCGNCASFLSSIRSHESNDSVRSRLGPLMLARENILKLITEREN